MQRNSAGAVFTRMRLPTLPLPLPQQCPALRGPCVHSVIIRKRFSTSSNESISSSWRAVPPGSFFFGNVRFASICLLCLFCSDVAAMPSSLSESHAIDTLNLNSPLTPPTVYYLTHSRPRWSWTRPSILDPYEKLGPTFVGEAASLRSGIHDCTE